AATAAIERFGHVDIVVNNAGISIRKPAAETTVEDIERAMAVNFFGAVYVTMALLPSMIPRRAGSLVTGTSAAGSIPQPPRAARWASAIPCSASRCGGGGASSRNAASASANPARAKATAALGTVEGAAALARRLS